MKVFLSWSGDRSKHVGLALRDWLPLVLHYAEPWLSATDIEAGDRWANEVGQKLGESSFGIVCLTRENINAPWVLFEAGALSKSVEAGAVVPYLVDVELSSVSGPLAQFQAKRADKNSTLEVVRAINGRSKVQIPTQRLEELFELLWPRLEISLTNLPKVETSPTPSRPQRDILEDLTEVVRAVERRTRVLEGQGLAGLFQTDSGQAPAWERIAKEQHAKGNRIRAVQAVRMGTGLSNSDANELVNGWDKPPASPDPTNAA